MHVPFAARLTTRLTRHANHEEHDSGDFFSDAYLLAWLRIFRARPDVNFYAYTKK
jgi:protein gp88